MGINRKFKVIMFLVVTIATFAMLLLIFKQFKLSITLVAAPSMGIGILASWHLFSENIYKENGILRVSLVLLAWLYSHIIAGVICGLYIALLLTNNITLANLGASVVATIIYSLVVSPVTITTLIVVSYLISRQVKPK
jgi:ABC-type sugar transport system permease subunit